MSTYNLNYIEKIYFSVVFRVKKFVSLLLGLQLDCSDASHKLGEIKRIVKKGQVFFLYKGQEYPEYIAHGNAASHIKNFASTYCKGYGLDIGSNKWPLEGAIPVDNKEESNALNLNNWEDKSLDYIFSSHCLEHIEHWKQALKLWEQKIKKGGIIFLYLPHESMTLWQPGSSWVGNDHKWAPSKNIINEFIAIDGICELIDSSDFPDEYYSFYLVFKKIK